MSAVSSIELVALAIVLGAPISVAQTILTARLKNRLIDEHLETYGTVERQLFAPGAGLARAVWRNRFDDLDDPEVHRMAKWLRGVQVLGIAYAACLILAMVWSAFASI